MLKRQWQRMQASGSISLGSGSEGPPLAAAVELRRAVAGRVGVSEAAVVALEKAHRASHAEEFDRCASLVQQRISGSHGGGGGSGGVSSAGSGHGKGRAPETRGLGWAVLAAACTGLGFGFPSQQQVGVTQWCDAMV